MPIWRIFEERAINRNLEIHEGLLQHIGAFKDPSIFEPIGTTINILLKKYKKVRYISQTFLDAFAKAEHKLPTDEVWNYKKDECGVIITGKTVILYCMQDKETSFNIEAADTGKKYHFDNFLYVFKNWGLSGYVGELHGEEEGKELINGYVAIEPDRVRPEWTPIIASSAYLRFIKMLIWFIDKVEIEVKEWKPNEKLRLHKAKYFNESKTNIQIVDCSWFTEVVRTTPFHVDGFYRWQACGEKWLKRKLIWVEAYDKKGYKRKARKESIGNI